MFVDHKKKSDAGDFTGKSVFLREKKRRIPPWLLPLVFTLAILFLILWLIPGLLTPREEDEKPSESTQAGVVEEKVFKVNDELLVNAGDCPIYDGESLSSLRLSSALYGERLTVLETGRQRARVRFSDGFTGWVDVSKLSSDLSALESQNIRHKALVIAPEKRVMSHTISGDILMTVPMGTILYADYSAAEVLRLILPDGQYGWISNEGVQMFAPHENPAVPANAVKLFVSTVMNFYGSRNIPGGVSRNGADMAGVIYISAKVNGLTLPRSLEEQAQQGEFAEIIRDIATGLPRTSLMEPGDVLFFHDGQDKNRVAFAAILLEKSQALTCLTNDSSLVIRDLEKEEDLLRRLVTVRRYFP